MVVPLLLGPDSGAVGYLCDTFEIWGATRYKHVPVLFNIYMNLHGLVIWGFGVSALYNDDPPGSISAFHEIPRWLEMQWGPG